MDTFLPVITTGSVFAAIIVLDGIKHTYSYLPVHIVLGILCVFIVSYIANTIGVGTAWAIVLVPFLFVFIGLLMEMFSSTKSANAPAAPNPYFAASPTAPAPASVKPSATCGGPSSSCLNPATVQSA